MGETAKIIRAGDEQAVRLPEQFQFDGEEVSIRRQGRGVYLEALGAEETFEESDRDEADVRSSNCAR